MTCFYLPTEIATFTDHLQTAGMISDFYPESWWPGNSTESSSPSAPPSRPPVPGSPAFGGYDSIDDRPGDDLLVGRLIAEQGFEVVLLPYVIETVPDYQSMSALLHKRLRWITVMRHMRPWGHLGLLCTQGLPWSIAAVAVHPTAAVALGFFGVYMGLRMLITWIVGIHGLKQPRFWKQMPLIPLWDACAFFIWLISFLQP